MGKNWRHLRFSEIPFDSPDDDCFNFTTRLLESSRSRVSLLQEDFKLIWLWLSYDYHDCGDDDYGDDDYGGCHHHQAGRRHHQGQHCSLETLTVMMLISCLFLCIFFFLHCANLKIVHCENLNFFANLKIFRKSEHFPQICKFSENLKIFQKSENLKFVGKSEKFSVNFPKIWNFFENLNIFRKFENFPQICRFPKIWKVSENWLGHVSSSLWSHVSRVTSLSECSLVVFFKSVYQWVSAHCTMRNKLWKQG